MSTLLAHNHKPHSNRNWIRFVILGTGLFGAQLSWSETETPNVLKNESDKATQEMRLEGEVKGQRSQPKVLFILPWVEKLETDAIKLDDSLISEEDFLAPIDRMVFKEQIKMYKQLETAQ